MLKTAAAPRTHRSLLTVAMGRRPSVTMVWRTPTRLSPPIWIFCSSNPAGGTVLSSIPDPGPKKTALAAGGAESASYGEPGDDGPASAAAGHQKTALLHLGCGSSGRCFFIRTQIGRASCRERV